MTHNQLMNIIKTIEDKNYEKKETILKLLKDKLDTSELYFDKNQNEENRIVFIYKSYKYKLAINSKGLLNNFIECKNFSTIIEIWKKYSLFIENLEILRLNDYSFKLCTKEYIDSNYLKKTDFRLLKCPITNIITFNEIKNDSNLYFYFKLFIELSKNYLTVNFINNWDFNFTPNLFKLNNFLNVYPKSFIKNFEVIEFELEKFLHNPDLKFLNENQYKIILNNYESDFNNLDTPYNYIPVYEDEFNHTDPTILISQ